MRIALVLRSGGGYKPEHVESLHSQLRKHTDEEVILISDVDVPGIERIPLRYDWPGWFSKIELCRPDIKGDLFYIDLDAVIVGDIRQILQIETLTFTRDFYRDGTRRPAGIQSCMMRLPERYRWAAWDAWRPEMIRHYQRQGVGDQAFFEHLWLDNETRFFQDIVPGQIVSYKVHCKSGLPADARIVHAHGKPKPWHPAWKL